MLCLLLTFHTMLVTAANLTGAAYVNADSISVTFSDAMGASALTAANYTISGAGAGDRTAPDSVTAGVAANEYLLTWTSGAFVRAEMLTVEASEDVLDVSSNPVETPRTMDVYVPDGDWVFVGGTDDYLNEPGVYPDETQPTLVLHPGSRFGAASWTDNNGNFWLFGGEGNVPAGDGPLNDFWKYNPQSAKWEFLSGTGDYRYRLSSTDGAPGTLHPGSRRDAATWIGNDGNLYLFGGFGTGVTSGFIYESVLSDFWKYNLLTNAWEYLSGSGPVANQYGSYSGAPEDLWPGSRQQSATWTDVDGNLWLFGGHGFAESGIDGSLNDLWKFDTETNLWEFVSGTEDYQNAHGVYQGNAMHPGSRFEPIAWSDSNNNLWLFGGSGYAETGFGAFLNDLWKFDVSTRKWEFVSGTGDYRNRLSDYTGAVLHPGSRDQSAAWTDSADNLWLFGGQGSTQLGMAHLNDLWKFDTSVRTWQIVSNRSDYRNQYGTYSTEPMGIGSRYNAASWIDDQDNMWLFGGDGFAESGSNSNLNDLWKYEIAHSAPQPGNTRIASAAFVDRNSISVTFSDEMPVTGGVMEPTNYRISGGGAGTRVAPEPTWEPIDPIIIIGGGGGGGGGAGGDGSTGGGGGGGGAGFLGGMAPRWADHTPTLANPATVQRLDENTYLLTWTAGQFAAGQPLIIHVDDEHIVDLAGDLLGAPNFMTLMIPFDAPGCICPTP